MSTDGATDPTASSTSEATGLVARVRQWIATRAAPTEAASSTDGLLSYGGEVHPLAIGIGVGIAGTPEQQHLIISAALGRGELKRRLSDDPHLKDLADEPAYAMTGIAIGKELRSGAVPVDAILKMLGSVPL